MQKFLVVVGKMSCIVAAAICIGAILIIAVYALPTEKIYHNVERSAQIYKLEGNEPYWGGMVQTRVDNFTDSIMLMKAAYPVENLVDAAFSNPSWFLENHQPTTTLINVTANKIGVTDSVWTYARYWHGYLVILKPALMFASMYGLRVLNLYVQLFLIVTALILIYRRLGLREMYAFLLVIAVINPITTALNLQNSYVFYIMLLSTIFILLRNEFLSRGENFLYLFLIIGIVTAYLDLLTYPITTLGIPLCICVLMNKNFFFTSTLKKVFIKLSSYLIAWGFGYAGMWAGKWFLATLFTSQNVIKNALLNAMYRTSTTLVASEGGHSFTMLDVFKRNIDALFSGPLPIILGVLAISLLYLLIVNRKKFRLKKSMALTFSVIILLPFAWYAVLKNHSYVHNFFTYRNLSIAIFGLTCFLIESFGEDKIS